MDGVDSQRPKPYRSHGKLRTALHNLTTAVSCSGWETSTRFWTLVEITMALLMRRSRNTGPGLK